LIGPLSPADVTNGLSLETPLVADEAYAVEGLNLAAEDATSALYPRTLAFSN